MTDSPLWILPTFGRPERCQEALDSIAAAGPSIGLVWVDGDDARAYWDLRLPEGWHRRVSFINRGVCGVLEEVFAQYPYEPAYGFISDDSLVRTPGWSAALGRAAGRTGFANSADGWQSGKRMHGAVCFGGDLLRALGCWAPPGLRHSFCDDAWERLGRALENWSYVPQVMVEHRHRGNAKAEDDETYRKAYSSFDDDRKTFGLWLRDQFPAAVARAAPLVSDNPERQRKIRARAKTPMLATPVARAPAMQYTLSLADTVQLLEREGFRHARQFVIGSSNLPRARNELVARFLASGCTDLIMIDDDMAWDPQSVVRLIASDQPVAAVVGRKRVDKPNSDPEVWCGRPDVDVDGGGIVQDEMGFVRFLKVGAAFMKVERRVFLALIEAHPEWKRAGHAGMSAEVRENYYRFFAFGDDEFETGEDFNFCAEARKLGFEIWVDPDQTLGHVGEKVWAGSISELMEPEGRAPSAKPEAGNRKSEVGKAAE